jgi:4,5-dihydroxyphthalate decarboxylase
VTFVVTGDEHLAQAALPSNCELRPGADLTDLIASGEVAAILGRFEGDDPNIKRLVPDVKLCETEWMAATGFTPVHHTIVVKDELLRAKPDLAADLFAAFVKAKQPMLERLANGADLVAEDESPTGPLHDFGVTDTADLVRPDPMPYGLEINRKVLEPYVRYCYDQHLIDSPLSIEEVFAPVGA